MADRIAVLLMAYGAPNSLDEIEPYYTDIRGGRKPSPEDLRELVARYQRIGVCPVHLEGVRRGYTFQVYGIQARALQTELGDQFRVYVGMKHWHPYIAEAVDEIVQDGLRRVIAIALAPHYSRLSIDGYIQRVRDAVQESNEPLDVVYVQSWNDHPLYLRAVAEKMQAAQQAFNTRGACAPPGPSERSVFRAGYACSESLWDDIQVVFSAHSLPERILQSDDPYPRQLRETCEGVAALVGLKGWRFAYQSAGRTNAPPEQPPTAENSRTPGRCTTGAGWLGPDILETLDQIAAEGHRRVLIAPIGFVADNLEILYDIDVECAERARALGLEMRRTESLNASPAFVSALAAIVREYQLVLSRYRFRRSPGEA